MKKIYAIRDQRINAFNPPFVQITDGEATRSFQRLVMDQQTNISMFPEDFDLYFLGEFDENTGKFNLFDTPMHLAKAVELKQ